MSDTLKGLYKELKRVRDEKYNFVFRTTNFSVIPDELIVAEKKILKQIEKIKKREEKNVKSKVC